MPTILGMQLDLEKSERRMAALLMLADNDPDQYVKEMGQHRSVIVDCFPTSIEYKVHDEVCAVDRGELCTFVFAPDLSAVTAFPVRAWTEPAKLAIRLLRPLYTAKDHPIGREPALSIILFSLLERSRKTIVVRDLVVAEVLSAKQLCSTLDAVFVERHESAKPRLPRLQVKFSTDVLQS